MQHYDLFLSERAKADALSNVDRGAWSGRALALVETLPEGWVGTGEDIRRFLIEEMSLEPPHHHNAWGGMISGALRRGLILGTGRYAKMRSVRSHARKTEIYRRL